VDKLLAREGVITDAESRAVLLAEAARAVTDAAQQLYRNANATGDYRPDPNAERFPEWQGVQAARVPATASLTFDEFFERWQSEARPAASTITTWRSYVRSLREHLGHDDPNRVTRAEIVAWKDALVAAGRTAKGIKDGHLTAIRSPYNYGVENGLLPVNPAQGVKIRYKRTGSDSDATLQ
jgi:hypothetical protein